MTAGRTSKVTVRIGDSSDMRDLSAHLNQLKATQFDGVVRITFNEDQYYLMDQSLWRPLADALFAFAISIDCTKLGI